jgi:fructose-specific phosphotransferase system IIC component
MAKFLGIVAAAFTLGYVALFYQMARRLPSQAWDNLILPFLPIVVFTLVVLIALAFLAAKLETIEQRIWRLDK